VYPKRLVGGVTVIDHDRWPLADAIEIVRWFLSEGDVLSAWPRIEQLDVVEARERLFATAWLASLLVDDLAAASATDKNAWFRNYVDQVLSERIR
jgi:hypothetical protein